MADLLPDQSEPHVCADCGADSDLYFHEIEGEWVCEEVPDCRERQFDAAMAERDRLRAENEALKTRLAATQNPCGCREFCGDDGDIDGPGTCKDLPIRREPLVEVVCVRRWPQSDDLDRAS